MALERVPADIRKQGGVARMTDPKVHYILFYLTPPPKKKKKKKKKHSQELGSFYVSGKLPTYPSPKPTLTLTSHLGQNAGLTEG